MTSKTHKKAFEQAIETFKAADAEAARLKARIDDIGVKLLQARLGTAQLETELDRLAISDAPLDEQLARNAELVRELATKRTETDANVKMLERAGDVAQQAYAKAKVAIVLAEEAALKAQADYYGALSAELIEEFLKTNATTLQRLLQVTHADSFFSYCRSGDRNEENARSFGIGRIDNFIESALAEASARVLAGEDSTFHDVVGKCQRGDPPVSLVTSTAITSHERGRIHALRIRGRGESRQDLLEALSQDDTPPPPAAMSQAEKSHAREEIAYKRRLIESTQSTIDSYKQNIARGLDPQQYESMVEHLTNNIATLKEHIAGWQAMLDADAGRASEGAAGGLP